MNIFFSRDFQPDSVVLDPTESQHCIKVLRLKAGDRISLVDGRGGYYEGEISIPDPRACGINLSLAKQDFGKRNYSLHIAIAPTKNIDRFEWFLEKATEIGVDEITPIICQRSERKVLREDRLEKLIISAMKQSIKAYLPILHPLTTFEEFSGRVIEGNKMIAHCMETERSELIKLKFKERKFTLLIGPEGDFSDAEVGNAILNGYSPVSLGSSRLRTETAGVVSCQIVSDLVVLQKP